jgi:prepilin-type N-terminal cleavage/methylation domain-containing protein
LALRDQRGFTLIELLITATLLSVVLLAILALLDTSARIAPQDQERGDVLRESQTGLHRMTRELRQAHTLAATTATSIEADVPTNSGTEHVTYDCGVVHPEDPGLRQCVRIGPSHREVVIDRIASASFSYSARYAGGPTTFAEIKLVVPARGALKDGHKHDIVLNDGFYMRNRDVAG